VLYCSQVKLWKLTDFGLSTEATSKVGRPTLYSRGTASYRAPELLKELDPVYTNKVDIWCLGCILHELMTSKFTFRSDWETQRCYETDIVPDISVPASTEFLRHHIRQNIQELLHRDPGHRPRASDLRPIFVVYCLLLDLPITDKLLQCVWHPTYLEWKDLVGILWKSAALNDDFSHLESAFLYQLAELYRREEEGIYVVLLQEIVARSTTEKELRDLLEVTGNIETDGGHTWTAVLRRLGDLLTSERRYDDAIALYNAAIRQKPNRQSLISLRLGEVYISKEDNMEYLLRLLHNIIVKRPEKLQLSLHFSLYLAINHFEDALILFDMNDFQSDIARQMAMSNFYAAAGKFGSAISCYMKDIMTDPRRREEWLSASEGLITALAKPLDSKEQSTADLGNSFNGYRFLIRLNDGRQPLSGIEDDIHSLKTLLTRHTAFAYRHRPTGMHFAAWTGNVSVLEELIHTGIDVNIKDPISHYTPLSLAVWNMHRDVIDLLLKVPTIELDIVNSHGEWTSLHLAAWNNDVNTIEKLSIAGANVFAKDVMGMTPMLRAAVCGNIDVVRALKAAGASLDISGISGVAHWHAVEAARRGHVRAIKALIEAEVDVSASYYGWTALQLAAADKGHVDVVKVLLEAGGRISVQDNLGMTALHWGASQGHGQVVKTLIEGGADVSVRDAKGWTPLDYALQRGRSNPCIEILEGAVAKRGVERES
jgi:ankyrin repeat protein